ncbi:hypothetical protein DL770_009216 [Monosporascus sp. CRB-9-2]|nr:hypothetical protein DL770_009216 [Monosporascus sp. CRB-9-2]
MTLPSTKVTKASNNVPYELIYWLAGPITRSSGRGPQALEEAGASYTDTAHAKDGMNSVLAQYDATNPPPFVSPVPRLDDLGIDGVKSPFPKFMAAAEKSCAYEREFKLYQAVKGRPGTKEHLASDRRQKHSTGIYRHYPELDVAE